MAALEPVRDKVTLFRTIDDYRRLEEQVAGRRRLQVAGHHRRRLPRQRTRLRSRQEG